MNKSDFIAVKQFFECETGKKFRAILEDSAASEMHFAETAYAKYENPSQQISAAVNRARGIHTVIDYIDSCIAGANRKEEEK